MLKKLLEDYILYIFIFRKLNKTALALHTIPEVQSFPVLDVSSFFKTLARNWRSNKSVDPGYKNFDYNAVTDLVLFTSYYFS